MGLGDDVFLSSRQEILGQLTPPRTKAEVVELRAGTIEQDGCANAEAESLQLRQAA
jgi:hypothetical protein